MTREGGRYDGRRERGITKRSQAMRVSYERGQRGSFFWVFQEKKDGTWHWQLFLDRSPQGPAARSGRGYKTRKAAEGSIVTAWRAMQEAMKAKS